ncbi:putative NBD/HSP70 family sugar kinase [Pseudoclavibacter sp. JAI123]|uniref:ROK family protein n=1 Tax=Pseudoclavibacter sp. JAI123 TaxID=2723065 RepID=UPI0015C7D572|nr:ROK family protein [Pseudoclavibacter sp. JAI123]NYF13181.1 putative NBD/HSP70 family sugar kinase [Pseudoclavibacter sp. JAI123]
MFRLPATPAPLKRANLQLLLEYAWDSKAFTATEALSIGLTRSTIIDLLDELAGCGLVTELPNAREDGSYQKGRPARRFEFTADAGIVVGVDAGREHLTTTVSNLRGITISSGQVEVDPGADSPETRRALLRKVVTDQLSTTRHTIDQVAALCVGVPAPVDARGTSPAHVEGFWQRTNPEFATVFEDQVPIIRVENDALLAAVAEGSVGGGVDCSDFVTFLSGERFGAGIVVDGRLLRGAHGGVGEMLGLDLVAGAEGVDGLGLRAARLARTAVEQNAVAPNSALLGVPPHEINGKLVLEAANEGDIDALRIVAEVGGVLARIVGLVASLFDPERVIIAGGVAPGADGLIAAAREELPALLHLPVPELVRSELGAGVVSVGAVQHALRSLRDGILDL